MNLELLMSFPEEIWTGSDQELAPEIKNEVGVVLEEELGDNVEYILQADSRGLGANWEVVTLIVGIPSAISGIWYLAEKVNSLISKLRKKGGVILPEKEALLVNINTLFSQEDLARVRLIRACAVSVEVYQRVRLGDHPFLYSYVIALATDGEEDEVHHVLIDDSGRIINHQTVHANVNARFYGHEFALSEYFFKK